ncbi:MAG: secondary thiamine-phosphate synthase enzyme YjbQ [Pseudomonadota bacterium]
MRQVIGELEVETRGPGLVMITRDVADWVAEQQISDGLLTLLCQHTSASLTVQENADPDVRLDLQDAMARLGPHGGAELYRHHLEGPDDMAAHIRTVLSGVDLSVPVRAGRLMLGTWQGIYLWEHRDLPHRRKIALHLLGE